jgi:hypothetical protein
MKKYIFIYVTILLFFLAACEEIKESLVEQYIILPFKSINDPVLDGQSVFVNTNTSIHTTESTNELIEYNLSTKEITPIYQSEFSDALMQRTQLNEDWILWIDSSANGLEQKILAMNRHNKTIKVISERSSDQLSLLSPVLYKKYVSWVELQDEDKNVILYDLENGKKEVISQLNTYGLFNNFVSLKDNLIVWSDSSNHKGSVYTYNIENKEIESYSTPSPFPSYALVDNGKIFSLNLNSLTSWDIHSFGYIDLKTGEFHSIDGEFKSIGMFRVSNDKLAIIDEQQVLHLYNVGKMELEKVNFELEKNVDLIEFDHIGNLILEYASPNENESKIGIIPK